MYRYSAIDEFSRLRFIYGYEEHSTYSSADFLKRAVEWYKRRGIIVECVQTDNGPEFTACFIQGLKDKPTLFQSTAAKLGIRRKLIRPYTPRHNGKVERSHIRYSSAAEIIVFATTACAKQRTAIEQSAVVFIELTIMEAYTFRCKP